MAGQNLILQKDIYPSTERAKTALAGHDLNDVIQTTQMDFGTLAPYQQIKEFMMDHHATFVRVDFQSAEKMLMRPWAPPQSVSRLRAVDSIFLENDLLVPKLMWPDLFRSFLVREVQPLHIRDAAYIVGAGPLARMVAFIIADLGYRSLRFVYVDEEIALMEAEYLNKVLFGLDIQVIPPNKITSKNLAGSLLVICDDLSEEKDFKANLAYYNFMANNATVVDLRNWEPNNILAEEAHRAGLRAYPPSKFWSLYEHHWLRMTGSQLTYEQFLMAWPF